MLVRNVSIILKYFVFKPQLSTDLIFYFVKATGSEAGGVKVSKQKSSKVDNILFAIRNRDTIARNECFV